MNEERYAGCFFSNMLFICLIIIFKVTISYIDGHFGVILLNPCWSTGIHYQKQKFASTCKKSIRWQMYNDNLGIFRCLAVHKGHYLSNLEITTKILYDTCTWCTHLNSQADAQECPPYNSYQGLILNEDLHEFENCFEVCVNLFKLCEDGSAQPERRSVWVSKTKWIWIFMKVICPTLQI